MGIDQRVGPRIPAHAGLPDLLRTAREPHKTRGSASVAMPTGRQGKPQHFCAWSKEQLGWLERPSSILVKQKLMLRRCSMGRRVFQGAGRPDASEYSFWKPHPERF